MIRVEMQEAEGQLSKLVEAAIKGEKVVICRADEPMVELKVVPPAPKKPRVPGAWKGLIPREESDELVRPWTDEEIAEFTDGPTFPGERS